jgi:predicted Zn-dependent protease
MKKIIILCIVSFVLLFSNYSKAEAKSKLSYNGENVIWKKKSLNICLEDSVKQIKNIEEYVNLAIKIWEPSKFFPKMKITTKDESCDIVFAYESFHCCYDVRPLAANKLTYNFNPEIIKATITINKYYEDFIGDAAENSNVYDLPSVIAHELGHAAGLDEDEEDSKSLMCKFYVKGSTSKRKINSSDLNSIKKLYEKK